MDIKGSIALVTGGNRGLGKTLVQALLDGGAKKVYVGARHLIETADPRLKPLKLDITDPQDISAAAKACQDVSILINNAGIWRNSPLIGASSMDDARDEIETNYLGTLAMSRAFAPILKKNGGGALVNVLSVVSWFTNPTAGSYSVSKAAEWSMTNGIRMELRAQGTLVIGVHASYIDTEMASSVNAPKVRPEDVAAATMKGIIAGDEEVLADQRSRDIKAALATDPQSLNREMQRAWDKQQR
ncbi:SDR family oxidoreductase [Dictyobacter kobayashii]|uniref:Short-chain dehydrogenase/reductase n=1 Tax=Dictyobacter kobayashii TaxID=2014872 RepID=A0A402AQK1_9CHLR|nr:SDR family oxidoreductase [Dictyobacter kobayashii]GCE21396.1 short-chain dehydrogenase/reductase [Dictyobacter kobayashii]